MCHEIITCSIAVEGIFLCARQTERNFIFEPVPSEVVLGVVAAFVAFFGSFQVVECEQPCQLLFALQSQAQFDFV